MTTGFGQCKIITWRQFKDYDLRPFIAKGNVPDVSQMKKENFIKTEDEIAALHEVGCSEGDLLVVHADLGLCWPKGARTS